MSATFSWNINDIGAWPVCEGQSNVVAWAQWVCVASQEVSGKTYTAQIQGSSCFSLQQGEDFTPYNQLTEEQILGWVWQSVSKVDVEVGLQSSIDTNSKAQPEVLPLPWATNQTEEPV